MIINTKRGRTRNPGSIDSTVVPRYFLDTIPTGLFGAYSFRQLRGSADLCVCLLRASDSLKKSFGFYNGFLDTEEVNSWISGTTATICLWYDQSGNNRDLFQGTTANQPDYSPTGLLGKPSAYFDGDDVLAFPVATTVSSGLAYSQVSFGKKNTTSDIYVCFGGAGTTYGSLWMCDAGGTMYEAGNGVAVTSLAFGHITSPSIVASKRTAGNVVSMYVNSGSAAPGSLAQNMSLSWMGMRYTGSAYGYHTGYISEAIFYLTEIPNMSVLINNINSFYAVY
jgi:hypothetical protein